MKSKGVVVVVDDDARILQSLAGLLESVGYKAEVFPSAEMFLQSGVATKARCVVADIGMPGMNGSVLREVLKREYPGLPVILITGRHELADIYEIDKLDVLHFFEKPFQTRKLLAAIELVARKPPHPDDRNVGE
jgi:FixJ family two-component response regulator